MYMFERPKRVNIIGRVRYPEDMNARFVIDSQFDDCWKSIGWLWVIVCALVINNCLTKKKKCVGRDVNQIADELVNRLKHACDLKKE